MAYLPRLLLSCILNQSSRLFLRPRGARVVWNEIAVDTAAGLGYLPILKYLIRNGCPWRSSAVTAAYQRGWVETYQWLASRLPPAPNFAGKNPGCGCPALNTWISAVTSAANPRCFPWSPIADCFQRCGDPLGEYPPKDLSCTNGDSFFLFDDETVSTVRAYQVATGSLLMTDATRPTNVMAKFLINTPPATTLCPTTGSKRAIIRGPRIVYLDTAFNAKASSTRAARTWSGSRVGFSKDTVICSGSPVKSNGAAPISQGCLGPRSFTANEPGKGHNFEFLNYHISDPYLRVVYIPPKGASGRVAVFNVTSSRMVQAPYESLGPPPGVNWPTDGRIGGYPIAARIDNVDIVLKPSDDRPDPATPRTALRVAEDRVTVLKLGLSDPDTPQSRLRIYITRFPRNGRLYQVRSSVKVLNTTFEPSMNQSAFNTDPSRCVTASDVCRQGGACDCLAGGNCDEPVRWCYYISETFVLGEPISLADRLVNQRPSAIMNSSSAAIVDASTIVPAAGGPPGATHTLVAKYQSLGSSPGCYKVDRYTTASGADSWSGEPHCDLISEEIIPSACRRCTLVPSGAIGKLPPGGWSGRLIYEPVHVQRYRDGIPLTAPSDPDQGGQCTLEELCRLGANTASKSSCVPWAALNGQGTMSDNRATPGMAQAASPTNLPPAAPPIAASPGGLTPCRGQAGQNCQRYGTYMWPRRWAPGSDADPSPYVLRNLTSYGDPVDSTAFYAKCGREGVHQVLATYETPVYMTSFSVLGLPLQADIKMRLLARTSPRRVDRCDWLACNPTHADMRDSDASVGCVYPWTDVQCCV